MRDDSFKEPYGDRERSQSSGRGREFYRGRGGNRGRGSMPVRGQYPSRGRGRGRGEYRNDRGGGRMSQAERSRSYNNDNVWNNKLASHSDHSEDEDGLEVSKRRRARDEESDASDGAHSPIQSDSSSEQKAEKPAPDKKSSWKPNKAVTSGSSSSFPKENRSKSQSYNRESRNNYVRESKPAAFPTTNVWKERMEDERKNSPKQEDPESVNDIDDEFRGGYNKGRSSSFVPRGEPSRRGRGKGCWDLSFVGKSDVLLCRNISCTSRCIATKFCFCFIYNRQAGIYTRRQ